MLTRYTTKFRELYGDNKRILDEQAPEVLVMKALAEKDYKKALSVFALKDSFDKEPALDAPQGRYEGLTRIQHFFEHWFSDFEFENARGSVELFFQTRNGNREVTELLFHFIENGKDYEVPMMVFADCKYDRTIDEMRIYFCGRWAGLNDYRPQIFTPKHPRERASLYLLTDVMRTYMIALHTSDYEKMISLFSDDITYSGYRPQEFSAGVKGFAEVCKKYDRMLGHTSGEKFDMNVRWETVLDDGEFCVIEFSASPLADKIGFPYEKYYLQAGCAAYRRNLKTGKLCSIRIMDDYGIGIKTNY